MPEKRLIDGSRRPIVARAPVGSRGRLRRKDQESQVLPRIGRGIPNLIVADSNGELLSTSYVDSKYRGPSVVLEELTAMLNK